MTYSQYTSNVFLNCPFDKKYLKLRNAILFAIFYCGFIPRCALEEDNSGNIRFEKIQNLIAQSKYAIHDISRTALDSKTRLPRFNMPLELGVFLGAKRFGKKQQKNKNCLILDKEKYRYMKFISDISGHDIRAHNNDHKKAISQVRNWLNNSSGRNTISGGREICMQYKLFVFNLPHLCSEVKINVNEMTYNDYTNFIYVWLKQKVYA